MPKSKRRQSEANDNAHSGRRQHFLKRKNNFDQSSLKGDAAVIPVGDAFV
jgi:hypothetical protein